MASQPNAVNCPEIQDRSPLAASANPYVFLVGCPRSGTTMLKRMISAHPLVAITRETHWIPRYFERRRGVTEKGRVTSRIVEKLFEHHRFEQMKISREQLAAVIDQYPEMTYASLVSYIFDNYGRRKKKPLVGDKTPSYVRKLPTLVSLWPETRIIHLIRDGRDVCLSMRNWRKAHKAAGEFSTWNIDPVVTTALWWKALVGLGREDGGQLGEQQYREVSYEALVSGPDIECRRLAHFLNLPYHNNMQNYYEGRTQTDEGLSTNAAWLPPTPGRRKWREQMQPNDVARFEAAAGNLLDQLGYERMFPTVSDQDQRLVSEVREQFRREAAERNWRLPKIW